jgi:guanylate kinase
MTDSAAGNIIVISGPSGAGKTTLVRQLFERMPRLEHSISATTRPPRPGEKDGIDYFFLTGDEFEARRQSGDFLECCQVFGKDFWYGTLQSQVAPSLAAGKAVVLEVDVAGAKSVVAKYPQAITIFVRPDSIEELERRLVARGTESSEALARRMSVARRELEQANWYQYQVMNHDVDQAVAEIEAILRQHGI